MRWLLACQKSGLLRELLRARGHDAWTCDLMAAEDGSPYHIQGDAHAQACSGNWDAMIAMPECVYLCASGIHWNDRGRGWEKTEAASRFFMDMINAPIERIAVENSVGIMSSRYRRPDQIIHPWQFGDDASKTTCLWLKNLPPLFPTRIVAPRWVNGRPRMANQTDSGQNRLSPSPTRSADRSRTFPGIAHAMDEQWGTL